MKTLKLIIKQKYFDAIMDGSKTEEFREIRPNTMRKYCEVDEEGYCVFDEEKGVFVPKTYDNILFLVGYKNDRKSALVEVKSARVELFVDDNDEFIVYEEDGKEYMAAQVVYTLGAVLEKSY